MQNTTTIQFTGKSENNEILMTTYFTLVSMALWIHFVLFSHFLSKWLEIKISSAAESSDKLAWGVKIMKVWRPTWSSPKPFPCQCGPWGFLGETKKWLLSEDLYDGGSGLWFLSWPFHFPGCPMQKTLDLGKWQWNSLKSFSWLLPLQLLFHV